jgi:hypothetical protein
VGGGGVDGGGLDGGGLDGGSDDGGGAGARGFVTCNRSDIVWGAVLQLAAALCSHTRREASYEMIGTLSMLADAMGLRTHIPKWGAAPQHTQPLGTDLGWLRAVVLGALWRAVPAAAVLLGAPRVAVPAAARLGAVAGLRAAAAVAAAGALAPLHPAVRVLLQQRTVAELGKWEPVHTT